METSITAKIEEGEWHQYVSTAKDTLCGRPVSVPVIGEGVGAQRVAERATLVGITDESKDALLDIATDQTPVERTIHAEDGHGLKGHPVFGRRSAPRGATC